MLMLGNSSVNVTLKVYPGMPHAFYSYPDLQPSIDYIESMVEWFEKVLGEVE